MKTRRPHSGAECDARSHFPVERPVSAGGFRLRPPSLSSPCVQQKPHPGAGLTPAGQSGPPSPNEGPRGTDWEMPKGGLHGNHRQGWKCVCQGWLRPVPIWSMLAWKELGGRAGEEAELGPPGWWGRGTPQSSQSSLETQRGSPVTQRLESRPGPNLRCPRGGSRLPQREGAGGIGVGEVAGDRRDTARENDRASRPARCTRSRSGLTL